MRNQKDGGAGCAGKQAEWGRSFGLKRWHMMRRGQSISVCGKRIDIVGGLRIEPPWHVACVSCLKVIQNNR